MFLIPKIFIKKLFRKYFKRIDKVSAVDYTINMEKRVVKIAQIGGPSGGCITEKDLDFAKSERSTAEKRMIASIFLRYIRSLRNFYIYILLYYLKFFNPRET